KAQPAQLPTGVIPTHKNCVVKVYFFFFSSRRRHTRWPRDWSSDVCSSDLVFLKEEMGQPSEPFLLFEIPVGGRRRDHRQCRGDRSEERRVGKECRSRCSRYH